MPPAMLTFSRRNALNGTDEIFVAVGRPIRGGFSIVYGARPLAEPTGPPLFAVKNLLLSAETSSALKARNELLLKSLAKDLNVLTHIKHPYILQILEHVVDHCGDTCLVTPWMPNGSLANYLEETKPLNRLPILHQIVSALRFLHTGGRLPGVKFIVHGDIHPGNVLIAADGSCRLSDFGLSKYVQNGQSASISAELPRRAGIKKYMAPELANQNTPRSLATDVFAFGILVLDIYDSATLLHHDEARLIGSDCSLSSPTARPSMNEVWVNLKAIGGPEPFDMLSSELEDLQLPQPDTVCGLDSHARDELLAAGSPCPRSGTTNHSPDMATYLIPSGVHSQPTPVSSQEAPHSAKSSFDQPSREAAPAASVVPPPGSPTTLIRSAPHEVIVQYMGSTNGVGRAGRFEDLQYEELYLKDTFERVPGRRLLGTGGVGDVYLCRAAHDHSRLFVMKGLRYSEDEASNSRLDRMLETEIIVLQRFRHPNILEYLGLVNNQDLGGSLSIVSVYAENGSLRRYLKQNMHADRSRIVRDVAAALAYLHSPEPAVVIGDLMIHVIHGNIHPANILIMGDGRAVVSDFGLSKLASEGLPASLSLPFDDLLVGVAAYIAPEVYSGSMPETVPALQLLHQQEPEYASRRTDKADVFAFGMLIFTTFGGAVFPEHRGVSIKTASALITGRRPRREDMVRGEEDIAAQLDDNLWSLVCECWQQRPSLRPSMSEVLARLQA